MNPLNDPSANDARYTSLLAMLRQALTNLAAPAEEQIAYLDHLGGSYDEPGLEFNDVAGLCWGHGASPRRRSPPFAPSTIR
jgi:hypothetical protein